MILSWICFAALSAKQLAALREVREAMGARPVVIRTMDIGGDKEADQAGMTKAFRGVSDGQLRPGQSTPILPRYGLRRAVWICRRNSFGCLLNIEVNGHR